MLARPMRPLATAVLVLATAACATGGGTTARPSNISAVPPLTPTSRVYDAERIQRTGAQTAWDAVFVLVPRHRLEAGGGAAYRTLVPRDPRSRSLSIRLVIDGHRVQDLDALRVIPAHEVMAIHLLSPADAAIYVGPESSGGAIVVQTKTMFRSPSSSARRLLP